MSRLSIAYPKKAPRQGICFTWLNPLHGMALGATIEALRMILHV
jgi:hypothetical protein